MTVSILKLYPSAKRGRQQIVRTDEVQVIPGEGVSVSLLVEKADGEGVIGPFLVGGPVPADATDEFSHFARAELKAPDGSVTTYGD